MNTQIFKPTKRNHIVRTLEKTLAEAIRNDSHELAIQVLNKLNKRNRVLS